MIAGAKVFTDASWKITKVPSTIGHDSTEIGVFLQFSSVGNEFNLMLQVSALIANSAVQAEAKALLFGAAVASSLQIHKPMYLTDSFLLAKAAAIQRPTFDHLN
jgi:hypothetical protein